MVFDKLLDVQVAVDLFGAFLVKSGSPITGTLIAAKRFCECKPAVKFDTEPAELIVPFGFLRWLYILVFGGESDGLTIALLASLIRSEIIVDDGGVESLARV